MNRLINEAKAMGNSFFGILGGEPFMHPELLEILGRHPDCYFQVFTNGHFITDEVATRDAAAGQRHAADQRRRQRDRQRRAPRPAEVCSAKTMDGLQNCLEQQGDDRRLHQPLPDATSTICSPTSGSIG